MDDELERNMIMACIHLNMKNICRRSNHHLTSLCCWVEDITPCLNFHSLPLLLLDANASSSDTITAITLIQHTSLYIMIHSLLLQATKVTILIIPAYSLQLSCYFFFLHLTESGTINPSIYPDHIPFHSHNSHLIHSLLTAAMLFYQSLLICSTYSPLMYSFSKVVRSLIESVMVMLSHCSTQWSHYYYIFFIFFPLLS